MGEVLGSGTYGMDMRRLCMVGWLQSMGVIPLLVHSTSIVSLEHVMVCHSSTAHHMF
jgi:hypothetical protein